jgi:hypothetical protein
MRHTLMLVAALGLVAAASPVAQAQVTIQPTTPGSLELTGVQTAVGTYGQPVMPAFGQPIMGGTVGHPCGGMVYSTPGMMTAGFPAYSGMMPTTGGVMYGGHVSPYQPAGMFTQPVQPAGFTADAQAMPAIQTAGAVTGSSVIGQTYAQGTVIGPSMTTGFTGQPIYSGQQIISGQPLMTGQTMISGQPLMTGQTMISGQPMAGQYVIGSGFTDQQMLTGFPGGYYTTPVVTTTTQTRRGLFGRFRR